MRAVVSIQERLIEGKITERSLFNVLAKIQVENRRTLLFYQFLVQLLTLKDPEGTATEDSNWFGRIAKHNFNLNICICVKKLYQKA